MFDPRLIRSLLAFCVVTAPLAAPTRALTPQTPPPCSADGHCKPNVRAWGYTPQQWRRWPGSEGMDAKPGEDEGRVKLPGTSPPRKEVEDQTAPPKVEGIEPQPRELEDDTEGTGDEFAPRRPGEEQFPPRAPERQPGDEPIPPGDDRLPIPRGGDRAPNVLPFGEPLVPQPNLNQPGLNQPGLGQPGLGQPGLGQPGLGQPPVGQPPLGQPPVRPQDPTLDEPDLPPPGGSDPDEDLFPTFKSPSIHDDAPPALPLLNGSVVERTKPSTPAAGVVRQAPSAIPHPTADRTTSVSPVEGRPATRPTAAVSATGQGVAGSRSQGTPPRVDRSIQAASYQQDAPPSLPSGLLR